MLFCGQCGLRLNPGDKQCSRCGTPVEPGEVIEDDTPQDAPTVASPSLLGQMQTQTPANPDRAGDAQKLVLRPDQEAANSNYGTQDAYEATRRIQSQEQGYGTAAPGTLSNPAMDPSHPADLPTQYSQSRGNYPSQQDMHAEYPQSGGNYAPQGAPYPGMGYQPYPAQNTHTATNARGRTASLLIILLGLLLILVAMALFILERNNVFGSSSNSGSPTAITGKGALTPEQQAQTLIQQYYDDINNKNFSAASMLWQENQRPELTSFKNGFKHTVHDAVTFNNTAAQGNGTVKVSVTIIAIEKAATGDSTSSTSYTGYYVVGPQNGTWQLLQGSLNRA